jgi:hypothetical protein
MVAVPWAVYSPSSDPNVLTVTVERDRIYSAPVFDYARIEEYSSLITLTMSIAITA